MRRILGTLVATTALAATAGCGSSTSSTAAGPDSPSPGPITGAKVLPLISQTGAGGQVSTTTTLLDTPAQVRAFSQQFRAGLYSFNLTQKRARKPAGAPDASLARKVTKVGVIGAGYMASQFALLFVRRLRVPVVITDLDQAREAGAAGYVTKDRIAAELIDAILEVVPR